MDRGGAGALMTGLLALALAFAAPPGFVWHAANGPDSVQYGSPGSDFRALRIDCIDGRLYIGGPASHGAPEGTPTFVTIPDAGRT